MPGGRPGHPYGSPEYFARKRRQARETYRRNRERFIARTAAYHAAQAGPGRCANCEEPAGRRVWVRSGSWRGAMCGACTRQAREQGMEVVLLERRDASLAGRP